jgi:phage terminase large subunit-like protein
LSQIDAALAELAALPESERLAVLDAIEGKRKDESYIRYWHPYGTGHQWDIFRNWKPEAKVVLVRGGNRSGKSEAGAPIAVAWALGKDYFRDEPAWEWVQHLPIPPPPNNIWVVGLDFPTVKNVLWYEKLSNGKDHPGFLPSGSERETVIKKISESDFQVYFKNGSVITCKSADSGREKFQGASVDLVWIDEEPDIDIYEECRQRTADCAGKILVTVTPLADISSGVREPWVYDLHEQYVKGSKEIISVSLSVLDNPFVPEDEKRRLKEYWAGKPDELTRLYGDFVRRSGLVYDQWKAEKHLIAPITLHKDWKRVVCIDPAPTGPTAVLWAAFDTSGNMYVYREYYEKNLVVSEHAKSILVRNGFDKIDLWLIDPRGGIQRNAETHKTIAQLYREAGIPVREAKLPEDFGVNAGREYINSTVTAAARHPFVKVFRTLDMFRWEIEHYVWDFYHNGPLKGTSKDKPRKRHDHLMNCFQYLAGHRFKSRGAPELSATEKAEFSRNNSYT